MGQGASAHLGVGPQLLKAAKAGDAELVTRLVSTLPGLLRYSSFHQLSAVHLAVRGDHVDVLRLLFAKAAELEHHAGREAAAAAPAGGSAAGRHADAARPLGLARRRRQQPPPPRPRAPKGLAAQVANAATDRGVTPLMLAAANGCVENVTLLLANVSICVLLLLFSVCAAWGVPLSAVQLARASWHTSVCACVRAC
jgi:ankyrin repeat protein